MLFTKGGVIRFLHPSYCFILLAAGTYIVWVIEGGVCICDQPWRSLFLFLLILVRALLCLQCILFPGVLGPNGPNEDRFRLNVTFTVATIYPGGGDQTLGKRHFSLRLNSGKHLVRVYNVLLSAESLQMLMIVMSRVKGSAV